MSLAALAKLSSEHHMHVNDTQLHSFEQSADEVDHNTKSWVVIIRMFLCHRSFFIIGSKMIGLGPDTLAEEHSVCILLGCSVPIILRQLGDQYIYLGEAYVDEYMTGRGIDELEAGAYFLQDCELR
jgi:hypothetical protein